MSDLAWWAKYSQPVEVLMGFDSDSEDEDAATPDADTVFSMLDLTLFRRAKAFMTATRSDMEFWIALNPALLPAKISEQNDKRTKGKRAKEIVLVASRLCITPAIKNLVLFATIYRRGVLVKQRHASGCVTKEFADAYSNRHKVEEDIIKHRLVCRMNNMHRWAQAGYELGVIRSSGGEGTFGSDVAAMCIRHSMVEGLRHVLYTADANNKMFMKYHRFLYICAVEANNMECLQVMASLFPPCSYSLFGYAKTRAIKEWLSGHMPSHVQTTHLNIDYVVRDGDIHMVDQFKWWMRQQLAMFIVQVRKNIKSVSMIDALCKALGVSRRLVTPRLHEVTNTTILSHVMDQEQDHSCLVKKIMKNKSELYFLPMVKHLVHRGFPMSIADVKRLMKCLDTSVDDILATAVEKKLVKINDETTYLCINRSFSNTIQAMIMTGFPFKSEHLVCCTQHGRPVILKMLLRAGVTVHDNDAKSFDLRRQCLHILHEEWSSTKRRRLKE